MKSTDDIAAKLAEMFGVNKNQARKYVTTVLDIVKSEVATGDGVNLAGFAKITTKTSQARVGRNPQTGEAIQIPEKRKLVMKPASAFAASLN